MRIVATAGVPAAARLAFAPLGEIVVRASFADEPLTEVLIVRGTRLDGEMLADLPELRAIARTGAGYDNLDVVAATRRGVPIVYAPGVGSQPVAEGTVALILAAAKRLRELGTVVEHGAWASRYEVAGLDIEGACLGVVGYGSIGRRVARLCRGLGMETIAYDPALDPLAEPELVPLEELLERADVITLHCGLTDATRGLVDRRLLGRVKPGAILVNVARGQIVESEDVLADALALRPAVRGRARRLSDRAAEARPSPLRRPAGDLHAALGRTDRALERAGLRLPGPRRAERAGRRPAGERAQPRGAVSRADHASHPPREPIGRCLRRPRGRRLAVHVDRAAQPPPAPHP